MKAKLAIVDIKNNFINFIQIEGNNLELRQIGIDIVSVLVNLPTFDASSLERLKTVKHLKRIINYIMAKLNSWGLVYCPYPKFPFLLFNNVHLNKLEETDTEKMCNKQGQFSNIHSINSEIKPNDDYQCFDYKYLYDTFIKNKDKTIYLYKEIIQIKWNEYETKPNNESFDFGHLIFNSHYLYIFYDTYFLFHIAALYYEVRLMYERYRSGHILHKFMIDYATHNKMYRPKYLDKIVLQIIHLEKQMHDNIDRDEVENTFDELKSIAKEVFTNSTTFNFSRRSNYFSETNERNFEERATKIINDMSSIKDCYLKINVNILDTAQMNDKSNYYTFRNKEIESLKKEVNQQYFKSSYKRKREPEPEPKPKSSESPKSSKTKMHQSKNLGSSMKSFILGRKTTI